MEFSREETTAIISLGVASGIIISMHEWLLFRQGHIIVEATGLLILFLACFGMIVSVYIHEASHKFFGGKIGYTTNTEAYFPGQVIGIVLGLFSFGMIRFFTPNTADLEVDTPQRLHKHRKYENPKQQAFIAASGILVTALFAILLQGAAIATGSILLHDLMIGNVLLMIYSLIPFELFSFYMLRFQQSIEQLPQSDGLYIFNYSIYTYVFVAVFAVALGCILTFLQSTPVWIALVLAAAAFLAVWIKFFLEQN